MKLLPEGEAALEALMVYGVRLPEGVNVIGVDTVAQALSVIF